MTSVTGEGGNRGIGVLGGTFDPPHIGHLRAAVMVRHALELDVVLLVPNGDPWQKRVRAVTPAPIRLEMARAAALGVPGLEVSDAEVRREGPSYTVDTVAELRAERPDRPVTVILGTDAAALVPTWERPDELLAQARLAVVARPGAPGPVVLPGADLVHVDLEQLDVSSSRLRADVAAGHPIDVLVAPGVIDVIGRRRLYRP
ncbi:MAG TPA: nicotinate-nucleotide adenylyltransferase [Acidimicrobiales bacterium]|nr:nicotinate-nucleotide adenylyltransferase [Acidimicrobiales bacterium]